MTLKFNKVGVMAMLSLVALTFVALLAIGYHLGGGKSPIMLSKKAVTSWQGELDKQRHELQLANQNAQYELEALSQRLGQLEAENLRLSALGERLIDIANIDKDEFNFASPAAQGGPLEAIAAKEQYSMRNYFAEVEKKLASRGQQLEALLDILHRRIDSGERKVEGRPVSKGWMSSGYGRRTDPFTGKPAWHSGVDFAAKDGADVLAVASGVVTWAGEYKGYGKMVEISHGNGLSTRYAHSKKVKVNRGDIVRKGDTIALVGSTGRATGPHVHFEVRQDGKVINPQKYIF